MTLSHLNSRSCPTWISVALPYLDLSGHAPPGSQWSCLSGSQTLVSGPSNG